MKTKALIKSLIFLILTISFLILLILFPSVSKNSVTDGILLCGRVIIPSLFPFMICLSLVINSNILENFSFISPLTKRIFSLDFFEFSIFVFSLVGGYPIGAKLLSESVKTGKISREKASKMLNFCINAGPAFIVSVAGVSILKSTTAGYILLFSHLLSSLIICLLNREKTPENKPPKAKKETTFSLADSFVLSVADSSAAMMKMCSFVLFFCSVNGFFIYFSSAFPPLQKAALFLEITTALSLSKNLYLIAFLLGFGGISIWCQVLSLSENLKIKLPVFIGFRTLHGALSSLFTYLLVKIFKITLPTLSSPPVADLYSNHAVALSLLIMGIIFLMSLSCKKDKNLFKELI